MTMESEHSETGIEPEDLAVFHSCSFLFLFNKIKENKTIIVGFLPNFSLLTVGSPGYRITALQHREDPAGTVSPSQGALI
jgi:hypothetical protein